MLDFDFVRYYEQDSFDNSCIPVRRKGLWENDERVRQGEKGVMLQAGKTDYSDCRRVRLAGWATPSFWQQRIPLVMSSNERASFIPRSRGVCMSIEKTKEGERREDETERGEKKGRKTKIAKKREARGSACRGRKTRRAYNGICWLEKGVRKRCQGCAWLKSMAVSSTGPANFLPWPKTMRVTTRDVNGGGSVTAGAKGTYIGPRSSREHQVREEFNLTESHMGLSNFSAWCASSSVVRDNRIAVIVRRIGFDRSGRLRVVGDVMKIKTVVSRKRTPLKMRFKYLISPIYLLHNISLESKFKQEYKFNKKNRWWRLKQKLIRGSRNNFSNLSEAVRCAATNRSLIIFQ